ncbi:ATP-grasp domain-containing protein [Streptomyces sp. NPDC056527]|uniref:ATP-grasp domain-containing protein n=1 Tax=Streptomyces sp. NPDC056527 TaxID=3345853 RepID=UPI0036B7BDF7
MSPGEGTAGDEVPEVDRTGDEVRAVDTAGDEVPVLLTSPQRTSTSLLMSDAAARRGMRVRVLDGPPEPLAPGRSGHHWYGGPLLADRIALPLGLGLLEPADAWLADLPEEFTARRVVLTTLDEARASLRQPAFVKPPGDKSFPPAVYTDGGRLAEGVPGRLPPHTAVLVSDVVSFASEFRLFALDGRIVTGSRYAVYGRLDPGPLTAGARRFGERLLAEAGGSLPSAVAVDIGLITDMDTGGERWAVVEANMPWFAHSYASEPGRVLDVVLRAAGPLHHVTERDRRFLRPGRSEVRAVVPAGGIPEESGKDPARCRGSATGSDVPCERRPGIG